jgi:hypothetical protein
MLYAACHMVRACALAPLVCRLLGSSASRHSSTPPECFSFLLGRMAWLVWCARVRLEGACAFAACSAAEARPQRTHLAGGHAPPPRPQAPHGVQHTLHARSSPRAQRSPSAGAWPLRLGTPAPLDRVRVSVHAHLCACVGGCVSGCVQACARLRVCNRASPTDAGTSTAAARRRCRSCTGHPRGARAISAARSTGTRDGGGSDGTGAGALC